MTDVQTSRRKRVFSGIQPSGISHIGNYLGAIRNWVNQQDLYDNIFCIVNLHAITIPTTAETLRNNTIAMANTLLAKVDLVRPVRCAGAHRALLDSEYRDHVRRAATDDPIQGQSEG